MESKSLPSLITVVDNAGSQYEIKGTGWLVTEYGVVTILLRDEEIATFVAPLMVAYSDKSRRVARSRAEK